MSVAVRASIRIWGRSSSRWVTRSPRTFLELMTLVPWRCRRVVHLRSLLSFLVRRTGVMRGSGQLFPVRPLFLCEPVLLASELGEHALTSCWLGGTVGSLPYPPHRRHP